MSSVLREGCKTSIKILFSITNYTNLYLIYLNELKLFWSRPKLPKYDQFFDLVLNENPEDQESFFTTRFSKVRPDLSTLVLLL